MAVIQAVFLGCLYLAVLHRGVSGFNYLQYANLYDGVVHLNEITVSGKVSWTSGDESWRAWEFLGVRYGTAERFEPPKFFDDYNSIREGHEQKLHVFNEPGPACIQSSSPYSTFPEVDINKTSEDCLFLNIHLPPVNQEHTLLKTNPWPVLIFLHGGDYQSGAGHLYNGNELARDMETVIVTLNYRLGLFGFLSTEDYTAKGNWGLKDVIMATKWVQQYISRFGADSSKLVLAGHGSGAEMVTLVMEDPEIREILSGVILMSGSPLHPLNTIDSPRTAVVDLSKSAGCPVGDMQIVQHIQSVWRPTVDGDLVAADWDWSETWRFNGNILQELPSPPALESRTDVPPIDFNGTSDLQQIFGSNDSFNSSQEFLQNSQIVNAKDLLSSYVSNFFGCNASQKVLEMVVRHCYSRKDQEWTSGRQPHPNGNSVTDILRTIRLEIEIIAPAVRKALNYGKNPDLLGPAHFYQLYQLDCNQFPASTNETSQRDMNVNGQLAYLFGIPLADQWLPDFVPVFGVTEQMRHLVGSFVKGRHITGKDHTHPEGGLLLRLGTSMKWKTQDDKDLLQTLQFWDNLKRDACTSELSQI
ncbi:putative Neuroligin-1 [Hypsibius exemplaris]|uniref:Neuroligin-1 n=1 Tax=Hypsibius exemplaris TaxID=2072580 RepID=A0A1W0X825_HYPEX|nr:putative Neuroligin-1 [Hypsibius exemplaris]